MGYTQYWNTSTDATPEAYKTLMNVATAIIPLSSAIICGGNGEGLPEINKDEIWLNGSAKEDCDYETFAIEFNSGENGFCKTEHRPYDEVVVAILIAGKKLGIITSWGSDGEYEDFKAGKILLEKALTSLGITL